MSISTKESGCQYTSVKIPIRLAEKIIASKIYSEMCYRSVSEFVIDSTRRRIE